MSRKGLSMRNVREVLRLRLGVGLSTRQVAESCRISASTVSEYEKRFLDAGLSWPLPDDMDDAALERAVRARQEDFWHNRPLPDACYLVSEMKRPHVTLNLLWLEYRESCPEGYGYTQFCHYYNQARGKVDLVLRQEHRAGEKLFTDYAGDTLKLTDPRTGSVTPVYIFVAVLGASNYTFAEGVASLDLPSWISSHVRSFEFFGGVPEIVVPDNTKCAVIRPDRYEPDLNPSFSEMASHYGTAVCLPGGFVAPQSQVRFVRSELERIKLALEEAAGRATEDEALSAGIRAANEVRRVLGELRRVVYTANACPIPALEMQIAEMLAIHFCSDRDESLIVLRELLDEARRRVSAGEYVLASEAARVFWVNPVADIRMMNLLEDCGGRVCGTEYLFAHAIDEIPEDIPPLEALARMALADPMVGSAADRARRICDDIRSFGAEALLISRIPGASHCATEGAIIRAMVQTELGIPCIEMEVPPVIDAMAATLSTRIEALVETVTERREQ